MANNNLPVRVGASALAAQNPNVSDEMEAAGLAFGELISEVGTSVAKTQNALDANSAKSASDLATTMAEIVVAEQVQYSENGIYSGITETRTMKLPLITAIDPVFYKWSNVRLQGQFYANEFKTSSQVGTQQGENSSHTGQSGLLVVFGGGSSGYRSTNTTTTTGQNYSADTSAGKVRMNTLLEPRMDVSIPKPRQIIRGPHISLIHGEIADPEDAPDTRTMTILVQYNRMDGTAIQGRPISIETDGTPWEFLDPNEMVTNNLGQFEIVLTRRFSGEDADRSPIDINVTARIGIVSTNTVVKF